MKFIELYQDKIMGAISGLDRIRFRGTLRWLASERGLSTFMHQTHLLLKDFGGWVNEKTAAIRESCAARAAELGIEMRYLMSSGVNKEALARQIAKDKNITQGSICMFSVVEPCVSPMVKGNKAAKKRDAGRTTRRLKLLRVHGLIRKVPKVNRYVLTEKGRKFSTAMLTASALDTQPPPTKVGGFYCD